MVEKLKNCNSCDLCKTQKPLLDSLISADVMWVGLSAKVVDNLLEEKPLSENTNTGKIIKDIEEGFDNLSFYKTNIVKCPPLGDNGKLRYPTQKEMKVCLDNLNYEVEKVKPSIIFLLGKKVSDFLYKVHKAENKDLIKNDNTWIVNNISYIAIHHPSYIHVYKRKFISEYVNNVQNDIEQNLNKVS